MRFRMLSILAVVVATAAGCLQDRSPIAADTKVQASEASVKPANSGRFRVHALQVHEQDHQSVITGHVGPATRSYNLPPGHVCVNVISPGGEVLASASGALLPQSISPRSQTERRFRVVISDPIPPTSQVTVSYHPSPDFCHLEQ